MANEQLDVSRVADRGELPLLLDRARQFVGQYIDMSLNFHSHHQSVRSLGATHRETSYPSDPAPLDVFRRR
jgi:hypothetical protein